MLHLTSEGFPSELGTWLYRNLDPNTFRMVIGSYNALAGYEFDNPEDLTLVKLKFGL